MVYNKRAASVYIAVIAVMCLLYFRLAALAAGGGDALPSLGGQYTRRLDIAERRGFIFDRNGEPMAGHMDGYVIFIDLAALDIPAETAAASLSVAAALSADEIERRLRTGAPFILQAQSPVDSVYAQSFPLYKRQLSGTFPAMHTVGYTAGGNGVTGLEAAFDAYLNQTGASLRAMYQSDALRRGLRGLPAEVSPGSYMLPAGITLTIDLKLQVELERICDEGVPKGAAVVIDINTGEILAVCSRPVFDVYGLAGYIGSGEGEFVNRALCSFTPGSVFKTVIAAAALEADPSLFDFEYTCEGRTDISGKIFNCHLRWGHGTVTMAEAYAASCNTYFMQLALELGYEQIYLMAKRLGIGTQEVLDGLRVRPGNVEDNPNPPPAFTANAAIGQGSLLLNPLEAARMVAAAATGYLPDLTLIKALNGLDGEVPLGPPAPRRVLSEYTVERMREMMELCVAEGTGRSAMPAQGGAGGKTSSAESGQYREIIGEGGPVSAVQVVHSWFAGYFPAESPEYAVCVVIEGGVTDGYRAGPVFASICEYLYGR